MKAKKRVSNYCFNANWAFFQLYHDANMFFSMKWWWCPLHTILLDLDFYRASWLKQQIGRAHVVSVS
jgi:hypothetical protein